jgi:hypothetical protein
MKYLATDLDKTLIPNGNASYDNTLDLFFKIINDYKIGLVYVTGRKLSSIVESIKDYNLQKPEFIVSQVGTKIFSFENEPVELVSWNEHVKNFNPNWDGQKIKELLFEISGLDLQNESEQNEFKISYYVKNFDQTEIITDEVKTKLGNKKIEFNSVLLRDHETKIVYLDILPIGVNKYEALKFLSNLLKFEDLIFAGDSGNDFDVLISDIKSILVNNASVEVKDTILKSNLINCYLASGKNGLNGNYSSGIIEGLVHYGWVKYFA